MLPLEYIRRHPDEVKRAAELKGEEAPVDELLELDRQWRECLTVAENARAQQNQLSKQYAKSRDPQDLQNVKEIGEEAKRELAKAEDMKRRLDDLLLRVPNLFAPDVPIGKSEADNVSLREWGEKRSFDFEARTHYDLGESLGIMDFEHPAHIAGSRFGGLLGAGARLQRALVQFMLDTHVAEHGYREIYVPFLVNSEAMVGTANLPKFGGDSFRVVDRDLWLVPTAEVPVTNWHRDEILDLAQLPLRYVAHTPCWRSEAGAAGKDTRGYIRMHQFEKVELVKLTSEETSTDELEGLMADAESILQRLGLHYRVLFMCTADMGFAQYKKYDLEAWCPGLGRYLEVSSCSVFQDFQARRANIRYRPGPGQPPRFVHTMNGSGLALARTLDAVMETFQQADGTILVPEVLRPYMGGLERIAG
ncbi:MAG: serine--tRNA ligase [Chloroflexi bacterium]|nr:MAG: serine--tRNA ligase [Chloroflexota bacterium]